MIGYEITRSKQAPFPFTKEVTVETVASAGSRLWKELVGNRESLKVTNIHLAFTGIESAESGQQSIEGFFKPSSSKKRLQDDELVSVRGSGTGGGVEVERGATNVCHRCGKSFYSPVEAELSLEAGDAISMAYIAKVKLEHEDFHLAQDLENEEKSRSVISLSSKSSAAGPSTSSRTKRRKPPNDGIEKFFRTL